MYGSIARRFAPAAGISSTADGIFPATNHPSTAG